MEVRVECYAGYKGEEMPRRFWLGKRCIGVEDIIDQWLSPDHGYFKLRGDDGATYILRHDGISGVWELSLYERGQDMARDVS